ncbi:monovalent cation/H+ antiporter subunit A [Sphingosinicella microcystinivorans]|uniref:monovalent cation/H+ antiporter subunit A n=1 Tax=Sphingosinicella microcystinivorans TaxID=335406 RepID=UPI0022F3D237|nr:monovalent cation/H+ antiporter subunit A [Sphingosinicella microcystinivorans]WBX83069.1 monovalent cation/H+ antiporter subunit A [Sphingosinicella microcystinivorans]
MTSEHILLIIVALPFLGSFAAAFFPTRARTHATVLAGLIALAGAGAIAGLYPAVADGGVVLSVIPWLPSLDLDLTFRLSGVSWLFALLVLVMGALVILYARYYMSSEDPVPRFFSFLMAFMGSMLGVVLSGNLVQIAFFWELTSLFSFLLIGYWHHNQSARDGARMSLIVTGAGGICLLLGFLLLGHIAGGYALDTVLASGEAIRASQLYPAALFLILIGAFTKSAQFPFHFWLPHAMAAPTPVSAYLHSATMVKAGVFVLILLWPVLSGTDAWYLTVSSVGLATLLVGAWVAIFQQDLKGLLAYSTISHLGLIVLLLGLGSPLAAVAAIFHTVNHATFKASLFMAAGIIDHETGTRDIRKLGGLYRFMPITATLAMVAAAAMAGVPLLNGFLSKEMFLAEVLETHSGTVIDQILPWLATLASAFAVLYSVRFIHQVFFADAPEPLPREPHEAPPWMRLPIEVLVLACLVIGIFPAVTIGPFLETAVRDTLGDRTPAYSLAVWHGFSRPLFLSLLALASGLALYVAFGKRLNAAKSSPVLGRLKARRTFEMVLERIIAGAGWLRARAGTVRLQPQLRVLLILALGAGILPFLHFGYSVGSENWIIVDPAFAIMWAIGGGCAIAAAWQAKFHRLAALILVGVAGLVTCISFVWLSAPDLAVTQLLVEIVTTVLLLLGLRWLPKRLPDIWPEKRTPVRVLMRRGSDLLIAVSAGIGVSLIAYAVMSRPFADTIASYFMQNAYAEGGGTNVVNVILVDFRAFDTLGEITVLGIVAITVFSLLRRFRPAIESIETPVQQRVQADFDRAHADRAVGDTVADYLMIPRLVMEWMFPVIIVFAIYLLLRGHDLPGGGFAAGITMSIGITLQYMANGTRHVEDRLLVMPLRWIGIGLLLAVLTGAGAWLFGYPLLTSHFRYVDLPLVGAVPVASALLFDIGVFALVVGATVLVLIALAHQSIRTPRVVRKPETQAPAAGEAR